MSDDLVKRIDSLMVLLDMERKKSLSLGRHIDKLEAALREITVSARLVGDYYHVKIARKALEGKDD